MEINQLKDEFIFTCKFRERDIPKKLGFQWSRKYKKWYTKDPIVVLRANLVGIDCNSNTIKQYRTNYNIYNAKSVNELPTLTDGVGVNSELKPMFPYQLAGVELLLQKKNVLLADDMGLGKTRQVIEFLNALKILAFNTDQIKVLIVSPSSLKLNWITEISKWSSFNFQCIKTGKDTVSSNKIVISYDLLHSITDTFKPDILIADEAHYLKSGNTKRTKSMKKIMSANKKILITGTPILNRPIELHSLLTILDENCLYPYNDYRNFGVRYCKAYNSRWGLDVSGNSNVDELSDRLKSTVMVRRTKKDVLPQLPDRTVQVVTLENCSKSQEVLDNEYWFDTKFYKENPERMCYGRMAEIRHKLTLLKVKEIIQYIQDQLETTHKVVVFCWHHSIINKLAEKLKNYGVVKYTGNHNDKNKQKAVDSFQNNNDTRVFIGQIQASGTGITLTSASTVIFAEPVFVPSDINQAIDRCHRIGQKDNVVAKFLVVKNTIDEQMLRSVATKEQVINRIIN